MIAGDYQITLWSKDITDSGHDETRASRYDTTKHPIKFRAYDDDGIFYAEGTVKDNDDIIMDVYDHLMNSYGVTLLKLYNRSSGEFLTQFP